MATATPEGQSPESLSAGAWLYLETHRIGHLATVDAAGHPTVVPLCYAVDGTVLYSALDDKPKRVPGEQLARVRNIRAHPEVALVVDDYSEDWAQLSYLLVHGHAEILTPDHEEHARAVTLLRAKYSQYQQMRLEERSIICIHPRRSRFWHASGATDDL